MKWDFLHELMPYSPFLQLTKQTAPERVSFWMSYFTAYCIVTLRQRVIFCVKEITLSVTIVLNLNKEYLSDDLLCSFLK